MKKKGGMRRIIRVVCPKCIKASFALWLAMICTDIVYSLVTVMQVKLLQSFFDNVTMAIEGAVGIKAVMISMFTLVFFKLLDQLLNAMSNSIPNVYWQKAYGILNYELHEKISHIKPVYFEDTEKLDYINKASQGCGNAVDMVCRIGYIFTYYGVYIVSMFIYLFTLNKLLACAILIIFIPNIISQIVRMKVYDKAEDKSAPVRRQYEYYEQCMVNREYYKETRLLGSFSYFKKLYLEALDSLQKIKFKAAFGTGMLDLGLSILSIVGYAGVMLLLFKCLLAGDISVGAFAAVFASVDGMVGMIESMMRYSVGSIATEYGTINNYLNFLELEEDEGKEYVPSDDIEIELDNVSFAYPSDPGEIDAVAGREYRYDHYGNLIDSDLLENKKDEKKKEVKYAIKDCSLHIRKGETVAIVGENGSGKSTIIRLITGLYEPSSGQVKYNGEDISKYRKRDIYGKTSAVFQKYQRYQMTLKENICISDTKSGKSEETGNLDTISRQAGIILDEKTYPDGYETMLSREFDGVDLSGGQWQRIAIGRAFYKKYGLIVLDEPTSAIDPYEETRIYNKFAEISKDKTAVIVTHRLGSVKLADRIVVMKNGRIVQNGTHEELLKEDNGEYARLYKSQEQWYTA